MTILYLKQCNCGCKKLYFGKTTQDIKYYYGSGVVWKQHLSVHKKGHKNIFIHKFNNQEICTWFALQYSLQNDIVNNDNYFNLKLEDGINGGNLENILCGKDHPMFGRKHTEKSKQLMSIKKIGMKHTDRTKEKMSKTRTGKPCLETTKEKLRKINLGKIIPKETRDKIRKSHLGKIIPKETRDKISNTSKGKIFSNETKKKISKSKIGKRKQKSGCIKKRKNKYCFAYFINGREKSKTFKSENAAKIAQQIYIGAYKILEAHY